MESPHGEIVFPKVLFGVAGQFSAARFVPSGSVTSRCESKPDLGASKHIKIMVSKWGLA
ncbi:hypothetical protein [Vibrio diabolicus]|uniref:hypothetical protein n=1 Tax=Vibrio diabolicus TaxID=50719 RepID=UPI0040676DF1